MNNKWTMTPEGTWLGYMYDPVARVVVYGDVHKLRGEWEDYQRAVRRFIGPTTGLDRLGLLGSTVRNLLFRVGFTTIEDVAGTSDSDMLKCAWIGKVTVNHVRRFIPYAPQEQQP